MEGPYSSRSLQFDETGHLLNEVPCIKCAYILRGLTLESACPECGAAVGRSLKGDFLKFADPKWLSRVATGMNWIVGAIVASIVLSCLSQVLARSGSGGGVAIIPSIMSLVAEIIFLMGIWMVTTKDPGATERSPINARSLTRFTKIGGFALMVLAVVFFVIVFAVGRSQNMNSVATFGIIAVIIMMIAVLLNIVSFFSCGFFAIGLARRMPNKSLVKQVQVIMIGTVILTLAMVGLIVMMVGMISANQGGGTSGALNSMLVGGALLLVALLVALILGIWILVLIIVFRNKLNKAANDARRTWASEYHTPVDIAQWEQNLEASPGSVTPGPVAPGPVYPNADFSPDQPDEPQGESQIDMSQWPDNQ